VTSAIALVASMQELDGSFPSEVSGSGWVRDDRNGFTTALVLRALRDEPDDCDVIRVRSAALDFIERCRSTRTAGAFGFWPEELRPAWAPRLPADLDDTAIMTFELLRYGRLSRRDGLSAACNVLIPNRVPVNEGGTRPPWVVPGAFKTWVGEPGRPNVVDCCVNANAVALMSLVGATRLPGYEEAVSTVLQGIAWAGDNAMRQQAITPFYPSILALREAVEHAIACGAVALRPALAQLQQVTENAPVEAGCCCSAYGSTVWRCRALDAAVAHRRDSRELIVAS